MAEHPTRHDDPIARADVLGDRLVAAMDVENVARSVLYMASFPLDANVQFMTVMATKMPFIGRG